MAQSIRPLGDYLDLLEQRGLLVSRPAGLDLTAPVALVSYDSRQVVPGTLFVCKGAHFKAEFLQMARDKGAMAYVSLEDDTGGMELLVFARALDQSGGYIRENQAILASGRISVRDEKEPQLMAGEIRPLDTPEAEERRERKLFIRLPGPDDPRTRKVKLALSFFPGEQPVVLYYQDIRKQSKGYCMIHPSLLADLRERLGEENVVVQ